MSPPAPADSPAGRTRPPLRALAPFLLPLAVLVALAVAFVAHLGHSDARAAGGNSVPVQQPVVFVPGNGGELCQPTLLPHGAASVKLWVKRTRQSGPPLDVEFTSGGTRIAGGHFDGDWGSDTVQIPIGVARRTYADAVMCVRNQGKPELGFMGIPSNFATVMVDGKPQPAAVTAQFFRKGESSWWSMLPAIAHRAGVLKGSLAGAWAFWAACALFAIAALIALAVAFRAGRADG